MKKALLVARWEFLTTITRRMYIFAVVAMPVFYGLLLGIGSFSVRSAARDPGRPVGGVDTPHILDMGVAARQDGAQPGAGSGDVLGPAGALSRAEPLVEYADADSALAALRARTVAAVYVVESDYLATGRLTSYGRDTGLFSLPAERRRRDQVADAIRAGLLRRAVAGDLLARIAAPAAHLTRLRIDDGGLIAPEADPAGTFGPFAGAFGVFFMLTLAIFFSAGFLQQATVEDRQNRMIEILLSSLDTDELLVGKILGLGAAGLLQVGIYVVLLIVPGMTLLAIFQVPLAKLALSLLYFVIGYVLFACLMAGTGSLGGTAQESAQLCAIWTLTAASPMFFLVTISAAPNGPMARVLSFFPLTGPVTMLLRLSSGDVPMLDIALSIAIGVAAIYISLRAASKILRAASLMYGKRATLPELIHWLRA
jgi:ABC-2 type transport system permease protein